MNPTTNATEASRVVGVNEKTVRRWIKDGRLPYQRVGRENLVYLGDVRRLASESVPGRRPVYRRLVWRLYWRAGTR